MIWKSLFYVTEVERTYLVGTSWKPSLLRASYLRKWMQACEILVVPKDAVQVKGKVYI